jgi:hypothetical protein
VQEWSLQALPGKVLPRIMGVRKQSEPYCTLIQQTKNVLQHGFQTDISRRTDIAADMKLMMYVVAFVNLQTNTEGSLNHPTCQIIAVTLAVSLAACRES